ncbi:BtrH N-terminal domain-containing protein [Carboxylicivirga sp. A043]|uniref:BtrH N-terminal domain-containing protein n=1 Tax=Carboxylicivirga litoralis TaxID=2816963 RepID=UPI0021CB2A2C|nr:BtrH N-terminal domain-containing protein [Carboxylicivirga sp. A043]MCU4155828.1 BtrH N-terminal domain-containing protein [Carboxylicivirga sp. A043]
MQTNYTHTQSAHCENGVITNFIRSYGHDFMTEPLAFGLGSGLFYIHLPFIKVNGLPAFAFRTMPGLIFKRTCRSLKIDVESKRFRKSEKAQDYLDNLLQQDKLVGCQVGVYNLSYFPKEYRFHFNAHNLIVYGKDGNDYLVSDPVMETVTKLSVEDMNTVRFAKGVYAPHGHLYYVNDIGEISKEDIKKGIIKGIKRNVRDMLHVPGPITGVSGIRYTAKKVKGWRDKLGPRRAGQYLGQIIRMQEEIGTGGGGFRFIYAAFLEQAAGYFDSDDLLSISDDFTKAGDMWRESAMLMAGALRGRASEQSDYDKMHDLLNDISEVEKVAFKRLSKLKLK